MNYDALVSALQAATELDTDEATSYFPVAIDIAQERLTRDLDVHGLTAFTTVVMNAGDAFIVRPSNARVIKSVYRVADDGRRSPLFMRTDEFINDYWPIRASTSAPIYYAPWGFNQFLLGPTPASSGVLEFSIVVRPTAVSAANQNNWFTDFASNALFYASMVEMLGWMKNASAAREWEAKYAAEISNLTRESKRGRRDDQQEALAPQRSNNFDGVRNG